jgi:selenide, water dikinase
VLSAIPIAHNDRVLVDFRTADDAGVYRWDGGPALVQTVDFFTPIVDDPFVYGEIAAANALSDVYAMGGRPLTALAIAGFPKEGIERDVIARIFQGGFEQLHRAGVALLGGHTVQDPEIKFGYAVTGAIEPDRILTNAGAKPGDVLFLTKPLGTGIVATALKFDRIDAAAAADAIESMRTLNRAAAEAVAPFAPSDAHACTDITGFGLAGHASEMAAASRVTLEIAAAEVPAFEGVAVIAARNRSGGLATNEEHFRTGVDVAPSVPPAFAPILFDPQTSGGLLVSVAERAAARLQAAFDGAGVRVWRIGRVLSAAGDTRVRVV